MIKIYDCSNSVYRPPHRGSGGPVMNDVMRQLKENAEAYDCVFVSTITEADVIITNDVFTPEAEKNTKPKLKRMDGVFTEPHLIDRNVALNRAARHADKVIFISNFAYSTYADNYAPDRQFQLKSRVILNTADPKIFKKKTRYEASPSRYIAVATDWSRPEKNLSLLLELARQVPSLTLIGTRPFQPREARDIISVPRNVSMIGYLDEQKIALKLQGADVMLCTAINDPAPKTVAQAIAVGIPIVYHNSGGLPELTRDGKFGMSIDEFTHDKLVDQYHILCQNLQEHDPAQDFNKMIEGYFQEIISL